MTSRAPFQGPRNTVRSEIFIQNCCHREQILSKKQKTKNGSLRTMTTLENRRPNRLFCTHDWDNFSISKILYIIIIRRRETGQPWKRWLQSSQSKVELSRYLQRLHFLALFYLLSTWKMFMQQNNIKLYQIITIMMMMMMITIIYRFCQDWKESSR